MKNLDKFFNRKDIPWVNLVWKKYCRNGRLPGTVKKGSFWWRDVLKLLAPFKEMANIQVNSGDSCFSGRTNGVHISLKNSTLMHIPLLRRNIFL